jgi:hypothetical protein
MSVESLIAQIQGLAAAADEKGRAQIQNAVRDLQVAIEAPIETLMRLSTSVSIDLLTSDLFSLNVWQQLTMGKLPVSPNCDRSFGS